MHYLVFESDRHRYQSYYSYAANRRISNTTNQFNLRTIRKSLKNRWTLLGAGQWPIQLAIWALEESAQLNRGSYKRHKYMNGHIGCCEDVADAIWFRLNHENTTKNSCKLIEIYSDLDIDFITEKQKQANVLFEEAGLIQQSFYQMHYAKRAMDTISTVTTRLNDTENANIISSIKDSVQELEDAYTKKHKIVFDTARSIANEVFEYIESKRTIIV